MTTSKVVLIALFAAYAVGNAMVLHDSIEVTRLLDDNKVAPTPLSFILTIDDTDDDKGTTIKLSYKHAVTANSSTVFFANDNKEITQLTFTDNKLETTQWSKPWNLLTGPKVTENTGMTGSSATFEIDPINLPRNTTRVSASAVVNGVIYNYYGIKNFEISLPDTQIIESYKPLDLSEITP